MTLRFILGAAGTGKTSLALREIRSVKSDAPMYYLVPEQFSLQSERLLLSGEYEAATRVQVLSFNRLAYRLFSALGGPPGKHADETGKQMLLRKVLFEVADELEFFKSAADKQGFVAELAASVTEMNHYRVGVSDLRERAAAESSALAAKLRDIALVLEKYRDAVRGRFLLTDEMPELLCERLDRVSPGEPLELLDGACFWVDGFSGFTPQERQVLLHILKRAAGVTVTLTLNDAVSSAPRETLETLEKLAAAAGAETSYVYMKENFRHAAAPQLRFFLENYAASRPAAHAESASEADGAGFVGRFSEDSIEIISASDKYTAVYAAAARVLQLVREKGYDFRDIAILCGDRARYEKILQNVFDREKIPMFVDTETEILSHPLTEMVRAALDIPLKNWNYESVFRFLKTRLTAASQETIDMLENFALAKGIHSYRWRYEFKDEAAETGRKQLLAALAPYAKIRANSKATVKAHAGRVFEMLFASDVPRTLQAWVDAQMKIGQNAPLHSQIWAKLCEVFDKLVEILGDETVTHQTFAAMLDAGLCQVGLGRIPPTTNQIVLGDITRSRYPQIRAMLVLGANDGALPKPPAGGGLLTGHERKILKNSALELAPENARRVSEQNYNLYCALSQPSEKLIFICAEAQTDGKPLRPAPIIHRVRKIFPEIKPSPALVPTEASAESSVFFTPVSLSPETAEKLHPQTIHTSATRLESFARCPFAYFAEKILGAKPRKLYEVLPADLGSLFHEVIAAFTRTPDFSSLSREEITRSVGEIVSALQTEDSIFDSSSRNKFILEKVRRVAAASCNALAEQLRRGEFRPAHIESEITAQIPLDGGKTLALTGRVDRVDMLGEQVKIIDYKSGATRFSMDDALRGTQLQLMLYMNAFLKSRENAQPAGVFYFPIDDPIIPADEILPDAVREEAIFRAFKLSGLEVGEKFDSVAFKQFSQEVENTVKKLGTRVTGGEIAAKPFTKGAKSPCRFCKFSAVCGRSS